MSIELRHHSVLMLSLIEVLTLFINLAVCRHEGAKREDTTTVQETVLLARNWGRGQEEITIWLGNDHGWIRQRLDRSKTPTRLVGHIAGVLANTKLPLQAFCAFCLGRRRVC